MLLLLDFSDRRPIYQQLRDQILEGIASGQLLAGALYVTWAARRVGQGDDDRCGKGGALYIHRDDPAILAEKRLGIGWS